MGAYAAALHLKNLLREELLTFLAEVVVAEKGVIAKLLEFVNDLKDEFGSLKDVSASYLPIVKRRLQKVLCKTPFDEKYTNYVKDGRSESIMHDLDAIQFTLGELMREIDGGVINYPPNILSIKCEFVKVLLSAVQEVKEPVTLVLQAEKAATSLCDRVTEDLLSKITSPDNDEVVNCIKIAADTAADTVEDFLTNTPFLLGTNHILQVKNACDLLNDIDQMLFHSSEEASFSIERSMKDGVLKDMDHLPLQNASHRAYCTRERNMGDGMLKYIVGLLSKTLQKRASLQREIYDDSTKLPLSHDLPLPNSHPTNIRCEKEVEEGAGHLAFHLSTKLETSSEQEEIVVGIDDYISANH